MFDKLIPWKKHHSENHGNQLGLRHDDDPVAALRRDFDNLLNRLWDEGGLSRLDGAGSLGSSVEFDENDNEYVMTAELPGFEPEDLDVKVSGNVLTVKAEHKERTDGDHGRLHRYGSFYESFTLPTGVKADSIDARYHSGVLEIHVPKDDATPSKRIEVGAA